MIDTNYKILLPQDFQAMVQSLNLNDFYFPRLFPLRQTYDLTWRTAEGTRGRHVAGDLVARGASYPENTREVFSRLQGDIPKTAIKRTKDENDIIKFNLMLQNAGSDANKRALINLIFEDIDYVYQGVQARLEWYALQTISTGKVQLTMDNNNSAVTEADIDYDLESWQKNGVQTSWNSTQSADPFIDFKNIVKDARSKGISLKYCFMNMDTWNQFSMTEQVIKRSATMAQNLTSTATEPSLEQVNSILRRVPYLNGLQIIVLDQDITVEKADKTWVTGNPFVDNVCLFSESNTLGETFWVRPADADVQGTAGYKVLNRATIVKQYGEEEPIRETTSASANAIPVWKGSTRSYLLKTNNTSWDL